MGFFSSRSLKTREKYISFAQLVWHNCEFYHSKIEKYVNTLPQKIYKLRKTNWAKLVYFSLLLREREEKKNQIFLTRGNFFQTWMFLIAVIIQTFGSWKCFPTFITSQSLYWVKGSLFKGIINCMGEGSIGGASMDNSFSNNFLDLCSISWINWNQKLKLKTKFFCCWHFDFVIHFKKRTFFPFLKKCFLVPPIQSV